MSEFEHSRPWLTVLRAQDMVQQVLHSARQANLAIAVSVVDDGGHLLAFLRSERAFIGAIDASFAKARTAAHFRRETADMQRSLEGGKTSYLALNGVLPMEGGVPLYSGDYVIGALGVSGATSAQDGSLARDAASVFGFFPKRT